MKPFPSPVVRAVPPTVVLALGAIGLAACGGFKSTAVAPSAVPTRVPTVRPTVEPTAEPTCPDPSEGTQLLSNERMGYCLLYPDDLFRVDPYPAEVCLVPEVPSLACHSFAAQIEVRDAGGRSVSQVVEATSAQVEQSSLTVAGEQAVLLPEVHGQATTREVMLVHEDRLYVLKFILPGPGDTPAAERFDRLYNTVIESFTLVPIVPTPATAEAGPAGGGSAAVVFLKDGDLLAWEERTGQSQTIYDSGDVTQIELSDDGQLVAFVRHTLIAEDPGSPQPSLWVVDRDGANPRELVSDEQLRAQLSGSETDDAILPGPMWIPNTHRLLYAARIIPDLLVTRGLHLFDVDTLTTVELVPAEDGVVFLPSPDGAHIALMYWPELQLPFFVNVEDSLSGRVSFIRPVGGVPSREGVAWTQDSTAVLVKDFVPASGQTTIWRVPVDGEAAQPLIALRGDRQQFAPDGSLVSVVRGTSGFGPSARFVVDLPEGVGPLAVVPVLSDLSWSPGGVAYLLDSEQMSPLCPSAAQANEVCGPVIRFAEPIQWLEWIDGDRFLYLTYVPRRLMLGSLDGETTLIADDPQDPLRVAAVSSTCIDDSEFVEDVSVPDGTQFAPQEVFRKTWRIRNTGSCAWDASYRLTYLAGDRMSGPRSAPLAEAVQPGAEVDLSVMLIAPASRGTYRGQWQLFAPDGMPFGARVFVEIQVP